MIRQNLFFDALRRQQEIAPDSAQKIPAICVAGYEDFDGLKQELINARRPNLQIEEYLPDGDERLPVYEGLPENTEFSMNLDERQQASLIETFEFCGAKVFRALGMKRGFIFA